MKVLVDKLPLQHIAQKHKVSCYLDHETIGGIGQFDYSLNQITVSVQSSLFIWFHELAHAIDHHVNRPETNDIETWEAQAKIMLWQFGLIEFTKFLEEYNQLRIEVIANKVAGYLCEEYNIPMDEHEQRICSYKVDDIGQGRIDSIIDYLNPLLPNQIEYTSLTEIAGLV